MRLPTAETIGAADFDTLQTILEMLDKLARQKRGTRRVLESNEHDKAQTRRLLARHRQLVRNAIANYRQAQQYATRADELLPQYDAMLKRIKQLQALARARAVKLKLAELRTLLGAPIES